MLIPRPAGAQLVYFLICAQANVPIAPMSKYPASAGGLPRSVRKFRVHRLLPWKLNYEAILLTRCGLRLASLWLPSAPVADVQPPDVSPTPHRLLCTPPPCPRWPNNATFQRHPFELLLRQLWSVTLYTPKPYQISLSRRQEEDGETSKHRNIIR